MTPSACRPLGSTCAATASVTLQDGNQGRLAGIAGHGQPKHPTRTRPIAPTMSNRVFRLLNYAERHFYALTRRRKPFTASNLFHNARTSHAVTTRHNAPAPQRHQQYLLVRPFDERHAGCWSFPCNSTLFHLFLVGSCIQSCSAFSKPIGASLGGCSSSTFRP